jgi:hypothetical protein
MFQTFFKKNSKPYSNGQPKIKNIEYPRPHVLLKINTRATPIQIYLLLVCSTFFLAP